MLELMMIVVDGLVVAIAALTTLALLFPATVAGGATRWRVATEAGAALGKVLLLAIVLHTANALDDVRNRVDLLSYTVAHLPAASGIVERNNRALRAGD